MNLKDSVKAIREAKTGKSSIVIGGKNYEVFPAVDALLGAEGIRYRGGEEIKGKDGQSIFASYVTTLKKSDANFEERFASIYDTVAGEMLLKDGIDVEGVNPSLKKS
jgi:hypothetical protein